ncbi:hypothetical protein K443DRAFT_597494 [Laccaria amethystina LaAM-08-1]|uniref:Peptidase A1 domain-containing protein n=1 Tax=Laccaria amethystina LaAM-08-1 TaxID=1095629 RepID=A0A0C9X6L4_9AGAR|nr:hypothetical protein K443DRAFT_597494 [Laccaria amethystina LaAM-08-1]
MALLSNLALSVRLLALMISLAHANIMVETIDGTIVPWSFVRRAGTGPVGIRLTNMNDVSYVTPVLMGTPPQTVQMATSLSQNFISVASSPAGSTDQSFYNPASSSSYTAGVGSASVQTIAGGTVQGTYAGEICTLQSSTSAGFFSYNASVVLTNSAVTNDLYPLGAHGVLGYGLMQPSGAPKNASLLGSFLPSVFTHAVCGIELNHKDDPVPDGIFTMGAVDQEAFTGNFSNAAVPANSPTSWSIAFDNLTYISNGVSQSMAGMLASVDMYHTGIQITSSAAAQLYAGIPGSQAISSTLFSLPCSSKFPITLTFGGTPFTINERDTIVKQADGSCTGVVTGGATTIGKVGAPFMRNVYTQFFADVSANGSVTTGVGFAAKKVRQVSVFPTTTTPTSTNSPPQVTVKPSTTAKSSTTSTVATKSSGSQLNVQDVGRCLKVSIILVSAIILTFSY